MQDPVYAVVVFAAMCVSAAIGFFIHSRLSEKHRSPESIALVQLMITLLVTFTAIVLGLLTTSVKAGFDTAYSARGDDAAQLAQLDRCLRDYGPETAPIREHLRRYVGGGHRQHLARRAASRGGRFSGPGQDAQDRENRRSSSDVLSEVGRGVHGLQPTDAFHSRRAGRMRWTIQRLAARQMEGDRGRAPLLLAAVLLGVGDLAFDPVRIVRPDSASERDGGDGHGSLRAVDRHRGLCHSRYGRALRRIVRGAQHLDAQRARRHDAPSEA